MNNLRKSNGTYKLNISAIIENYYASGGMTKRDVISVNAEIRDVYALSIGLSEGT